jgi:hypothetical protein
MEPELNKEIRMGFSFAGTTLINMVLIIVFLLGFSNFF